MGGVFATERGPRIVTEPAIQPWCVKNVRSKSKWLRVGTINEHRTDILIPTYSNHFMVRASKVTSKPASFLVKLQAFCRSTSAKCVPRAGRTGTLFPDASCTKHTMQKMPRILLESIVGAEDIASSHMTAPPTQAQINQWHYCTSDAVTAPPRVCLPEVPH